MEAELDLLIHALKEWAIAVSALQQGQTIMLLRKGGIREGKQFQIKHHKVWLYPTYEHQKPQLLKPKYSGLVTEVTSGWHPVTVNIQSYGEITHTFTVNNLETLEQLEPYHVWNRQMVSDRFNWKPQKPIQILLIRVFNLPQPVPIPYHQSYGGCKSWIDLQKAISIQNSQPALEDNIYQQQVTKILQTSV